MKQIVFSAVQPSGELTIGNYIGSLRKWVFMQKKYKCFFCIVDLHTIISNNLMYNNLRQLIFDILAIYIAIGIDPVKSTVFIQSNVPEHSQLGWILNGYTSFGPLSRMTQFKDKSYNSGVNINAGLFNYPLLMAADILLYKTNKVPVGEDQKQHLEITRNIAKRFNARHGPIFTIPSPELAQCGKRVMSLLNPFKKMSKSDKNNNNVIKLLDKHHILVKKIKNAVTDSNKSHICYDNIKTPGISNIINIISGISDLPIYKLEQEFKGKKYIYIKNFLIDFLSPILTNIQARYYAIRADETYLNKIIREGSEKARSQASITLSKVYKSVGLFNGAGGI